MIIREVQKVDLFTHGGIFYADEVVDTGILEKALQKTEIAVWR